MQTVAEKLAQLKEQWRNSARFSALVVFESELFGEDAELAHEVLAALREAFELNPY